MAALRAPFAIAVFLNVDCGLDNEFGLAGAVVGGVAIGLLCLEPAGPTSIIDHHGLSTRVPDARSCP